MTVVDAVLFDAGGVLLLPDPAALRRAFAPFGAVPDDETCRLAHYSSMRELDRVGHPDWDAVDRVLARAAGVPEACIESTYRRIEAVYLTLPWVPVVGAAEVLVALQRAGLALAVVSNASGTMEQQLAEHRICSVDGTAEAQVAIVVDSHVVGVEKPAPGIFEIALSALGLPASRCLYVGDTVHFDVEGARSVGMPAMHFDPYRLCPDEDHPHLTALEELLDRLTFSR